MLVLDYLKNLETRHDDRGETEWIIKLPPFLTGPLGLHSGRVLEVMEAKRSSRKEQGRVELIVADSTFVNPGQIVRIQCTLWDKVGVVNKLISALARLNINIVAVETSGVDSSSYHVVHLIADLTEGLFRRRDMEPGATTQYSKYTHIFPTHDFRCQEIFEHIVAYCGSSIVFEGSVDPPEPMIDIKFLSFQGYAFLERIEIAKAPDSASIKKLITRGNQSSSVSTENQPTFTSNGMSIEIATEAPLGLHLNNELVLKGPIQTRVRARLAAEPRGYLLMADTDARVLRLFLVTSDQMNSVFHVAVKHANEPGALEQITRAFSSSGFNILASLLRTTDRALAIWEATVQYTLGEVSIEDTPSFRIWQAGIAKELHAMNPKRSRASRRVLTSQDGSQRSNQSHPQPKMSAMEYERCRLEFVAEKLAKMPIKQELNAWLDFPHYPYRQPYRIHKGSRASGISLSAKRATEDSVDRFQKQEPNGSIAENHVMIGRPDITDVIEECDKSLESLRSDLASKDGRFFNDAVVVARYQLQSTVKFALKRRKSSRVFLSYPSYCKKNAILIKEMVKSLEMEIVEQQEPDGSDVMMTVLDLIKGSDFFIGIWGHEEKLRMPEDTFGVSPWMPFEFGIAKALGKECLVLCSERVNKGIWDRIERDVLKLIYNDIEFPHTVNESKNWILKKKPRF